MSVERARSALFSGAAQQAFAEAKAVLAADPRASEALLILGTIALEHGNQAGALDLAGLAARQGDDSAWLHVLRGRALLARQELGPARLAARLAGSRRATTPQIADMAGVLLARAGLHEAALPHFEQAVAAAPDQTGWRYNLATARQFAGDLAGAARDYRALLAAAPDHHRARLALVQLTPEEAGPARLAELEALFAAAPGADDRLLIGHALARTHEDLRRWDDSFAWLERAKAAKAAHSVFDPAGLQAIVAALHGPLTAIAATPDPAADAPIFVIGMPRSGTTLVERILTSHSQVASAGELSDFALWLKRAARTPGARVLDAATLAAAPGLALESVGAAYLDSARALVGDAPRFVDKMPFNAFFAPAILAALPGARIVCLRRDPVDTAISNYRQLFATDFDYYDYSLRLEDTARMVAAFDRVADHYARVLPPARFRTIRYEDVVGDLDGAARGLLDFCGLAFEPACLTPERNARPVATASSAQVRAPVHGGSVGRLARYEASRGRIEAALAAGGVAAG